MEIALIKTFLPTALAFLIGVAITPFITHYLYHFKAWKKQAGKGKGYGGGGTPIFDKLHKEKDTNTPRLGGIVIWASVFLTVLLMYLLSLVFSETVFGQLNFLSRSQTWLPLLALAIGAAVGFLDDYLTVRGTGRHFAGGLPLSQRLLVVGITALFSAWWFYEKLEVSTVNVIGFGPLELGLWFIPFFVFVGVCVYMSSVIDGIDGLSGGVFMFIFAAYAGIALYQNQVDIAAFCATVVGGILAFLWFNVPPARFYMTETGVMALTMALTVVAFMTDSLGDGVGVSVLPVVGILLVATVAANVVQILSKKLLGRKVLLIAPLHHHFEAVGWPAYKVTMRYWILGFVAAVVGVVLAIGFSA
jgi:phospho-N-acetylmuramoyl-pentapeptide-transferase